MQSVLPVQFFDEFLGKTGLSVVQSTNQKLNQNKIFGSHHVGIDIFVCLIMVFSGLGLKIYKYTATYF